MKKHLSVVSKFNLDTPLSTVSPPGGAAATVVWFAGCIEFGESVTTIDIAIQNNDDTDPEPALTITFDATTLFEQTTTLAAGGSADGPVENPNAAGPAQVGAALDGKDSATDSVRVGPETGTQSITMTITPDGVVQVQAAET